MQDKIKNYFKNYPESNECFSTSDGFLFHAEHAAKGHASSLKDKKVETHKRGLTNDEKPPKGGTAAPRALKAEYKELYGKNPAPQWKDEKLLEMIEAKKAELASAAPPAQDTPEAEIEDTKTETK